MSIPTIKDYSHWGEEAKRIWYEENRFDMENSGEYMGDDDFQPDYEDDPKEEHEFESEEEARKFFDSQIGRRDANLRHWGNIWVVEVY